MPVSCYNIYPSSDNLSWQENVFEIGLKLLESIKPYELKGLVYESPEYFDTGRGATTARSGALEKLLTSAGSLVGICVVLQVPCVGYKVREWKGQLPKNIVEERIRRALPGVDETLKPKAHSWDAIGIGLYAQGALHR